MTVSGVSPAPPSSGASSTCTLRHIWPRRLTDTVRRRGFTTRVGVSTTSTSERVIVNGSQDCASTSSRATTNLAMSPRMSPSMSLVARAVRPRRCCNIVPPLSRKLGVPVWSTACCKAAITTVDATSHPMRPPAAGTPSERSACAIHWFRIATLLGCWPFGFSCDRGRTSPSVGSSVGWGITSLQGVGQPSQVVGADRAGARPAVQRLAQQVRGRPVRDALLDRGRQRHDRHQLPPRHLLRRQDLLMDHVPVSYTHLRAHETRHDL